MLATPAVENILSAMHADEVAIDRLFARHHCTNAYLDVGTNIGVQLRKLVEPKKYPKAAVNQIFGRIFGDAQHRCSVCLFGFEPNPRRKPRLLELTRRLTDAGVVIISSANE